MTKIEATTGETVIISLAIILFTLGLIVIVYYDGLDEINMIDLDEMDCTELWNTITEHVEEVGLLPPKAHAQWLVMECWS
jgi:hypothetical protein